MPPRLALILSFFFIIYLFRMDRGNSEGVSSTIWIPFIWMFLAGSRYVSQWLNLSHSASMAEGSPVDRAVFLFLIIAGIIILRNRKINWGPIFRENAWIWIYFIFGAISFIWSDYPFISFKRWVKAMGNVIMVLIILTEDRPYLAIGFILRRLSFILLPLSVVFIKYYPHLGRAMHHTGVAMYRGVSTQKNGLGALCLLSTIYFSWNLLLCRNGKHFSGQKLHNMIYFIMFSIIAWLFHKANSATSLSCLIVALSIFLMAMHPAMKNQPRRVFMITIMCLLFFGMAEYLFDIKNMVITMLGRRPDLTTRVPMWADLLSMVKNPITGFGYESFWLGARRQYMIEEWAISLNAHNGYLEMYLNMGVVGLFIWLMWVISGLKNVSRYLVVDYPAAMLRFCLIIVVLLYNYTEATFYGVNNMWLLFFLGIIDPPESAQQIHMETPPRF